MYENALESDRRQSQTKSIASTDTRSYNTEHNTKQARGVDILSQLLLMRHILEGDFFAYQHAVKHPIQIFSYMLYDALQRFLIEINSEATCNKASLLLFLPFVKRAFSWNMG